MHHPEHVPDDPDDEPPDVRLAARLCQVLTDLSDGRDVAPGDTPELTGATVRTFADEELLTLNPGIVIHARNGTSFQLRVIRSR